MLSDDEDYEFITLTPPRSKELTKEELMAKIKKDAEEKARDDFATAIINSDREDRYQALWIHLHPDEPIYGPVRAGMMLARSFKHPDVKHFQASVKKKKDKKKDTKKKTKKEKTTNRCVKKGGINRG